MPGGKGGIPPPKAGSCHSHLGSWVGLHGSRLYLAWHFTWVCTTMSSYNKPHLRNDSIPPFSLFSKHLDQIENLQSYFKKILILTGIFTTLIWEYHYLYTVHQFKSFIETVLVMTEALKAMSCIKHVNWRFFSKEWSLWVFSRAQ